MDAQSFPSDQRGRGVAVVPCLASDVEEMVDGLRELLRDMADRIVAQEALLAERHAPADPALLALEAIDLPRYRSVLPMAHHDQARADAERALARFGAYVARDWFRRTSGFQAADGYQLDAGALETGVVTHGATVGYRHAPGIADAIAALLAPDGADGADGAGEVARECQCRLRTRLVGDGCDVCNPELAAEYVRQREATDGD